MASDLVDPLAHRAAWHVAPNHIESFTGRLSGVKTVDTDGVESAKHRFRSGQILYSKIRPYLAKATLVDFAGVCSADMYPIDSFVDTRFLLHWMLSSEFTALAAAHQGRSVLPKINQAALANLGVPVAPLAEQERIVAAIEEAFSKLDAGASGLQTVRHRLKRMRDAVLTAAVSGHLVPQDPADTSATRLLADRGVEPLVGAGLTDLPTGWAWVALDSIATAVRNGVFVSRPAEHPPGVPILRIGSVRRFRLDLTDVRYADLDASDPAVGRALLAQGDLLFTRYNGNPEFVGACAVVPKLDGLLLHPDKLIRVKLDSTAAFPEFVAIAASIGVSRSYIDSVTKTTAGQAGIAGGELKKLPVPLAPLAEQQRIAAEVDRQFSFIEACERAVDAGLARSAALRRSVLKAAFEGKLVAQDPADEPASVLLERIRGEREAPAAAPKRPRRAQVEPK